MSLFIKNSILLFFFVLLSSAYGTQLNAAMKGSAPVQDMRILSLLSAEQRAFLDAHPVIRVANETDWPPYDFMEHGRPTGYAIEHMKLLAGYLGLKLEFVNGYTWSQLLALFQAKKIDVMPIMYRNSARNAYTDFTKPYVNTSLAVVVQKQAADVRSLEDLAGKKVAVLRDDGLLPVIENFFPQENIVFFTKYLDLLLAVSTGKVDACIGSSLLIYYHVNEQQITNLKVIDYIIQDKNQETSSFLHIGVRNDWTMLRDILDLAMSELPRDDRERISVSWFHNILPDEHVQRTHNLLLTSDEQAYLRQKKTIRISVDPDWLPFGEINQDGLYCGMGADLVRAMEKRLRIDVELVPTKTWAESIQNITRGRCDMLPVAMNVPSRRGFLDFTTPYLVQPFVIATRIESPFIQDTEDILGKTVGIVRSYAHTEAFRLKYPALQVLDVDSIADGLHRLHDGTLDGYVDSLAAIGSRMQIESLIGLKIAGTLDLNLELSMATRKDDPMLGVIAQKFIDSIDESEMRAMFNTWVMVAPQRRTDYRLAWKIVGVAALLLFGAYLWNRRLARFNNELSLAHKELDRQSCELKRLSRTDVLTQLPNRRQLDEIFDYEIERCRRFDRIFSIILIDIDHFKEINDTFGHQAGDKILVELAGLLQSTCRKSDTIGRWGGEEFLIISPELVADNVPGFAEKLRRNIAAHPFCVAQQATCSFGVATYVDGDDAVSLLKSADDALYRAKEKGRNRVEV